MQINIRKAEKEDVNFILSTTLKCLVYESKMSWNMRHKTFFDGHQKLLLRLLLKPTVNVSICCDGDDPWHLFGYLISEPKIVHFIYIKKDLRKFGIATKLLENSGFKKNLEGAQFSHYTGTSELLWKEGKVKGEYNPYLLLED